jgi:hypothetical protein
MSKRTEGESGAVTSTVAGVTSRRLARAGSTFDLRIMGRKGAEPFGRFLRAAGGFLLVVSAACERQPTTPVAEVAAVVVSVDLSTIGVGEHASASAILLDEGGRALPDQPVTWRSSNPEIATVDRSGTVTGQAAGTTTIAATRGTASGGASIAVVATLPNIRVDDAQLLQVVQSVPLIAGGHPVLVRVFGRWDRPLPKGSRRPLVRVEFFRGATPIAVDERPLTGIVTTSASAIHEVVMPAPTAGVGLNFRITVNPDSNPPEATMQDNGFPRAGQTRAADVRVLQPLKLHFVPLIMPPFLDGDISTLPDILFAVHQVHPVSTIDTTIGPAMAAEWRGTLGDRGALGFVLRQVDVARLLEKSRAYYVAVMGPGAGFSGIGFLGSDPTDFGPGTHVSGIRGSLAPLAHELGHNMGRLHAPCANPADNLDPTYPYPGGVVGVAGADLYTWSITATFPTEKPTTMFDLMSYCGPRWISDYTYDALLRWRTTEDAALRTLRDQAEQDCLIVWGSVDGDSIHLEPSFTARTRPALPRRPGAYSLSGSDARGASLFTFSFDPARLDHGETRQFLFAIPFSISQESALARIAVAGEGRSNERLRAAGAFSSSRLATFGAPRVGSPSAGRATISWDTSAAPLLIAREPLSGRVLGIGQSGRMTVAMTAGRVEVLLSDGIRSVVTTLARP